LLDFFLPCTRKEPHYRIYFSPSLFLGLEDFFDPTVMPLSSPRLYRALGPPAIISAFLVSSSPSRQLFLLVFLSLWIARCQNLVRPLFRPWPIGPVPRTTRFPNSP